MFDAKSCVWQWIASYGIDPNPMQVFNLATQPNKVDINVDLIGNWLSGLKRFNNNLLGS